MKKILNFTLLTFTVYLFISCNTKGKPNNFDYGKVDDNVYINSFFDCHVKVPKNWIIQTKEQTDEIANLGKNLVAGDDEKIKSLIEASEVNTANLLAVFKFEVGSPVDFNPNFLIVAENVTNSPGIKNGSDYLFQSKKLMENSQFKYDYLSENFESEFINGTEFHKMYASVNYLGTELKQIYYSTIKNRFSFNIIISFINDHQKDELLESVNSITFSK